MVLASLQEKISPSEKWPFQLRFWDGKT
jgi:hypothetical protein